MRNTNISLTKYWNASRGYFARRLISVNSTKSLLRRYQTNSRICLNDHMQSHSYHSDLFYIVIFYIFMDKVYCLFFVCFISAFVLIHLGSFSFAFVLISSKRSRSNLVLQNKSYQLISSRSFSLISNFVTIWPIYTVILRWTFLHYYL